jgi:hypothetical protein
MTSRAKATRRVIPNRADGEGPHKCVPNYTNYPKWLDENQSAFASSLAPLGMTSKRK